MVIVEFATKRLKYDVLADKKHSVTLDVICIFSMTADVEMTLFWIKREIKQKTLLPGYDMRSYDP